eukprot:TRINITY_DN23414_c0_g1_i1.p1 TRINITY_DN23414_c0_g1~~TRINITY_DN23414_c0_g1_i1.p1  ORF type:complete len:354 (-),score=55.14 TRINITY_DN23414_c0_g1_i1:711-1751(-)
MALLFALCLLGPLLWLVYKFSRSDADLLLLSKGAPPVPAFKGKVVWITGASKGIGESLAVRLADLGARLILSARNLEGLQKVKGLCKDGAEVELLPLDLTAGSESLQAAAKAADELFDGRGLDYVFHNAGYPRPKMTCLESTEAYLRALFELNVFAPIELSRACLPAMIKHGKGRFVVVSSAAGKVPSPTQGVYAASKHALQGYFHTLRYELIGTGVGVTVVCPGPIATPTPRKIVRGDDGVPISLDAVTGGAPDDKEEEKNRMTSERCTELIIAAAGHGVDEAWISTQPVLAFLLVMQYAPWLGHMLLRKIGPKRVQAMRAGSKDLYTSNLLFGRASVNPQSKLQ